VRCVAANYAVHTERVTVEKLQQDKSLLMKENADCKDSYLSMKREHDDQKRMLSQLQHRYWVRISDKRFTIRVHSVHSSEQRLLEAAKYERTKTSQQKEQVMQFIIPLTTY
jgi:hypothetical protein